MFCRSTQRKQSKRPDIPIYVPKARRSLPNNTIPSINSTTNSSNVTLPSKLDAIPIIEDDSSIKLNSKDMNDLSTSLNLKRLPKHNQITSLDSFQFNNSKDELSVDEIGTIIQTSLKNVSSQISEALASSCVLDLKHINEFSTDSSVSDEIIVTKTKSSTLEYNEAELNIYSTIVNNCDNDSIDPSLPDCLSNNTSSIFTQNCDPVDLPDFQISDINNEFIVDTSLSQKINKTNASKAVDGFEINDNESVRDPISFQQEHKICLGNEVVESSLSEIELESEYKSNCPNYCFDDSFTSGTLTDKEENISNAVSEKLTIQQSSESVNKPQDIVKNNKKNGKKKTKKKVLDVDECSWEDLYDKEDDYIHPLLMKEVSL